MKLNIALSALTALAIGALAIATPPGTSQSQWEPYLGPKTIFFKSQDREVYFQNVPGGLWNVAFSGDVTDSVVSIDWTERSTGDVSHQAFALAYWHSAVALDDDGLGFLVAGKRRNGNTVIDHYRYPPPTAGQSSGGLTGASAISITNLYDDAVEGRDMVCAMERLAGSNGDLALIQFYDSHDIAVLDMSGQTPTVTTLASPNAIPSMSAAVIPELSERAHFSVDVYNHANHGYTYMLQSAFPGDHNIVITDPLKNGTSLQFHAIHSALWDTSGFGDFNNYSDW